MAHVVRRLALSRRTLLGAGAAALALPWLDAMRPAFAAPEKGAKRRRIAFVFHPNGQKMDEWKPEREGSGYELPPTLAPLAAHKKSLLVLSGLTIDGGRPHGDGPGDHAREAAPFLTCAHPFKTGGADIKNGVSVDQVLAGAIGRATAFPSLELGVERHPALGDSGYSPVYGNNISWRTPSQPMPKETDPRAVFARLFGDPDAAEDAATRARHAAERASVLDAALGDAKKLAARLGPADRAKLDEYLMAVREVEQRLEKDAKSDALVTAPEGLKAGGGYPERVRLFYELIALAFQADRTRVATLMLGNGGSILSYSFLDVPEGHHELSHHGRDPKKLEKLAKIGRFHSEQLAGFLARLESVKEDGEPLLDRTMVLYGGGLADPDAHAHHDLPVLLAGRGHPWKTGRHLRLAPETPMANLYLSLCEAMDAPQTSFADSTKPLL
jgi:hypothetical protein